MTNDVPKDKAQIRGTILLFVLGVVSFLWIGIGAKVVENTMIIESNQERIEEIHELLRQADERHSEWQAEVQRLNPDMKFPAKHE